AASAAISRAPENDIEHNARREQEFVAFDPHFKELKAEHIALLRTLAAKVGERGRATEHRMLPPNPVGTQAGDPIYGRFRGHRPANPRSAVQPRSSGAGGRSRRAVPGGRQFRKLL